MEFREMFGMKPFSMLTSPVRILLIINAVVFVLSLLGSLFRVDVSNMLVGYGALIPEFYTQWWRYITYAFIHVNVWHFLFNMLAQRRANALSCAKSVNSDMGVGKMIAAIK